MLLLNRPPIDYSLCNQTVTVYSNHGGEHTTTVYPRAHLDFKKTRNVEKTGSPDTTGFLLVIPGEVTLYPGDKVLMGEGEPVTTREEWAKMIPATTPGLCVVKYVDPKYWNGVQCHVEAGG